MVKLETIAAHLLRRKGIGIEIDPTYCALALKRLRCEAHIDHPVLL
ncbi:MAG: hypothetical protein N3A60_03170 [Thermanaerothrix sp.]|nr:hypothetical protein [Thermanaerothrix sp.]